MPESCRDRVDTLGDRSGTNILRALCIVQCALRRCAFGWSSFFFFFGGAFGFRMGWFCLLGRVIGVGVSDLIQGTNVVLRRFGVCFVVELKYLCKRCTICMYCTICLF